MFQEGSIQNNWHSAVGYKQEKKIPNNAIMYIISLLKYIKCTLWSLIVKQYAISILVKIIFLRILKYKVFQKKNKKIIHNMHVILWFSLYTFQTLYFTVLLLLFYLTVCISQLFQSFFPITDIATYRLNLPRGQFI